MDQPVIITADVLYEGPAASPRANCSPRFRRSSRGPFLGDWSFYTTLRGLANARVPLATVVAGPDGRDLRSRLVAVTEAGRDVLARRRDHLALNRIDGWRGGVHLEGGTESPWRRDEHRETLVS